MNWNCGQLHSGTCETELQRRSTGMTVKITQRAISILTCMTSLAWGMPPIAANAQDQAAQPAAPPSSTAGAPAAPAPLTADQLDSLVAPIALYPDALVAQVLGAALFPDQVVIANQWIEQNKTLTGTALSQAIDQQYWDPSIKALSQFPSVLNNLASNLA